jgi:hypothetical protein
MDILNHRTLQLAEEHRRQLLSDAGADRDDVLRHRLELHRARARSSPRPTDLLPHIGRKLGRALVAWLAVVAIAGCGTHLSAGAGLSADRMTPGWHVAPVEGSPEAFSYPEYTQASAPIADATTVASDYPPQERDVPELSSLLVRNPGLGLERAEDRLQTWSGDDLAYPGNAIASSPDVVDDTCLWHDCSVRSARPAEDQPTTDRPAIGQRGRCTADGSICGLVPERYYVEP